MADKKRRSSGSKSAHGKRTPAKVNKETKAKDAALHREVTLILSFAACIVVLLCNFSIFGPFGEFVKGIMFGLFGVMSYVLPVIVFGLIAFSISNRGNRIAKRKTVSFIVLLFCIGIFFHMIMVDIADVEGNLIGNLFTFCKENLKGGGVVFGIFGYFAMKYLKLVGSVIILLVIIIICLVIITERSFIGDVQKGADKVKETVINEKEKLKEYHEINSERDAEGQVDKSAARRSKEKEVINEEKAPFEGIKIYRPEEVRRENMHEIILKDEPSKKEASFIKNEPKKAVDNSAFVSDIPSIKATIRGASDMATGEIVLPSEMKVKVSPGAPVSAPHSFGMTEEYKTPEEKAREKRDAELAKENALKKQNPGKPVEKYQMPPLSLLIKSSIKGGGKNSYELQETADRLQEVLQSFGVNVTITDISQGPTVTRYEMQPEIGVKVQRITSLADDIKLNLAATDIRIEAPIPGKAAVGIEIPNKNNSAVLLRDLFESDAFKNSSSKLSFAVGKDISGQVIVSDIAKMPHVLIAGTTGSGKSVCINTLIMSILYKARPDEVQLIMVDPKVVELSVYNGIPHLLVPVVTDPKKASASLQWAVGEMMDRYKKFADQNVRDLKSYNEVAKSCTDGSVTKLPQIVIIVDELADLMMVAGKEVEESIVRLAQLARAAGIHLVIATQRPSADVITGLIKANMPSRIAFAVSNGIDSRIILDTNGAEKLLGKGDMLFYPSGYKYPERLQGAFVSDKEVADVVSYLKNQNIETSYSPEIESQISNGSFEASSSSGNSGNSDDGRDELFYQAGIFIIEKEKASIGFLQRQFRIGFNRAARIMDQLADYGVVGEEEGTKPRRILMSMEEFENTFGA